MVMLLSDLVLGYTTYGTALLHSQFVVYACIVLTVAMGKFIHDKGSPLQIGGVTVLSSVVFFIATNFTVWATDALYPRTGLGLFNCYTAAIPFIRNSLAGL